MKKPTIHSIPHKAMPPKEVPDNKRPSPTPANPGGLPPKAPRSNWRTMPGSGHIYHTHS